MDRFKREKEQKSKDRVKKKKYQDKHLDGIRVSGIFVVVAVVVIAVAVFALLFVRLFLVVFVHTKKYFIMSDVLPFTVFSIDGLMDCLAVELTVLNNCFHGHCLCDCVPYND